MLALNGSHMMIIFRRLVIVMGHRPLVLKCVLHHLALVAVQYVTGSKTQDII